LHNGMQVTRRATIKGSWERQAPEYDHQCKKRWSDGRVASDGDRYAAMVSDDVGVIPTERRSPRSVDR
jgi:hypothetical protein